jgi:integrase/recombinase XerD
MSWRARGGHEILAAYQQYWKTKGHWGRNHGLGLYIRALEDAGIIRRLAFNRCPLFPDTEQYISFLKSQKGLSKSTINYHTYWVQKFLQFLGLKIDGSLIPPFGIGDIDNFISQEGIHLKRTTQQILAYVLRGFTRFLYQSGRLSSDLSCLIASPRCYQMESLPQVLSWDEVNKVLHSVDLSTKIGLQHYAVLILLTTYGLRAGEVAHLKLEDIDWRRETIHISQKKTGRNLSLPLTPQVGKAILKYLKQVRPPSGHREIFLLTCAPWTPFTSSNVAYVARKYIKRAGLKPPHQGPHIIRHSFATHLIRGGVSLKEIGDMLGHHSLESTHIYTKTATENLREVALEVPEVG